MMLCGVSVVVNSLGDVLGLMSCKRSSENGQVLVGFQSTEAFGCLHHARGGPAQRHRGISPSLHVVTYLGPTGMISRRSNFQDVELDLLRDLIFGRLRRVDTSYVAAPPCRRRTGSEC